MAGKNSVDAAAARPRKRRIRNYLYTALAPLLALCAIPALVGARSVTTTFPTPIQHVVVIYQENHSFDEVLGDWCNTFTPARCDGYTGTVTLYDGTQVAMWNSPDVVPSVAHQVGPQAAAIDGGKMDGWNKLSGCTANSNPSNNIYAYGCLTYFTPSQVPSLTSLATKFAVSDRTFSMADSPSWGGHLYSVAASLDGFTGANPRRDPSSTLKPGPGWGCDSNKESAWVDPSTKVKSEQPSCVPDYSLPGLQYGGAYKQTQVAYIPTIMDSLDAAGLSWRLYAPPKTQPQNYGWAVCPTFAECLDGPQSSNMVLTNNVLADAQNGTLPNFSLVLPAVVNHTQVAQHNGASMMAGDNWIGQVVSAIENGPDWDSTTIFITYDDCGCFYDHVPPGKNPDGTKQGPRVPMVIVSPYVKAGYTDSTPATFASVLAYTESVLGLQPLNINDQDAYNYSNAFDYSQTPLTAVPLSQHAVPAGEHYTADTDDPT
jgi:phospholipase C